MSNVAQLTCPVCHAPACTCSTMSRPATYHPTLEGHPAWEAFRRAPVDEEPVSDEEREAVEEARRGAFTREVPVGVVERDVTPANAMTTPEVRAYVRDVFGTLEAAAGDTVARRAAVRTARSRIETIVGALLIEAGKDRT